MELYICEKPSQGRDLAAVLGASQRGDGCIKGDNKVITWAFGHLLEMLMPDDYDEKYKSWSLETLPIAPDADEWKNRVRKDAFKQYKVIEALVKSASSVIVATDYDREGEAIARSLLDRFRYKGPVKRLCLTALDESSIRKALSSIKDGKETMPLYFAALARQRADWLVGMNISRLYTVLARSVGFRETLHVGRVLTPTVSLVCSRDKDIANFKPSPFWVLQVTTSVQNGHFKARWLPNESVSDDQGRCINKPFVEQVAAQVKGAAARITKAETKPSKESAPLPFDLTSLQQYAAKRWGYTAQQTLDAAQSLYEVHKATSYPRTDSRYLPESQRADVPAIMQAIIQADTEFAGHVAGADINRKARAFNDKKVTAHHAIIPTPGKANLSAMSAVEYHIYDAIRRFFIAQFYSDYEFSRTVIELESAGHTFVASGKTPLRQGWKVLFTSDSESDPQDDEGEENEEQDKLPPVNQGEPAQIQGTDIQSKMTRPSPHFTEATLLAAMENIARFVEEEHFKQILKETAGLGTPATRAGIIEGAVKRGYFVRQKKILRATDKAHALIEVLPLAIKSPGLTAAWEQQLEAIADGSGDMNGFMRQITGWVTETVEQLKQAAPSLTAEGGSLDKAFRDARPPEHKCFACGGLLRRIKGKNGFFWGCQNEPCRKTFPDNKGKPESRSDDSNPLAPSCGDCGSAMRIRRGVAPGKQRATRFWGCTAYPVCKGIAPYSRKEHEL